MATDVAKMSEQKEFAVEAFVVMMSVAWPVKCVKLSVVVKELE